MRFFILLTFLLCAQAAQAQTYEFRTVIANGSHPLSAMKDVSATAATDGQVLTWDAATSSWQPAAAQAGASALNDLTDTSAASPNSGDLLTFDGSNWVPQTVTDTVSTTTMVSGWPDAISCDISDPDIGTRYLNLTAIHGAYAYYSDPYSYSTMNSYRAVDLQFIVATGALNEARGIISSNCNTKSISQLYADGQAFNFIGNNGASTNLNEIGDVSATAPTDGQALVWSNSNSRWEPTDMTSGLWTQSGSDAYYSSGNVGIGTTAPNAALDVAGTVSATRLTSIVAPSIKTGAAPVSISTDVSSETDPQVGTLTNSKWCTSDGSAINCTSDAPSSSDDLGSHTATQDLAMGTNSITGATNVTASGTVTGANVTASGTVSGASVTSSGDITATGTVDAGELTSQGLKLSDNSITEGTACTSGNVGHLAYDATNKIMVMCVELP